MRFLQMLKTGFEDEVSALYARGDLHGNLPAIRSVGCWSVGLLVYWNVGLFLYPPFVSNAP